MSKTRMSRSYIISALLHGVAGYFVINAAVRVALPEGEVLEMAVDDATPPKGETLEQSKPQPLPPKTVADANDVEELPKKSQPIPKPLPVIKEKISDVSPDDAPEEKSDIKDNDGDLETKVANEEKPEPKETPQEESPPAPPVPVVTKEEDTKPVEPAPVTAPEQPSQAVAENSVPAPPTQQPSGTGEAKDPAQYGVPAGAQIKDASLLASRPGNRPPQYPHMARLKRQQGDVQLLAYVNSQGKIEKLFVEKSSGHPALDQAAHDSFKKWAFYPGQADWVRKTIRFVLKDN